MGTFAAVNRSLDSFCPVIELYNSTSTNLVFHAAENLHGKLLMT